MLDSNGLPEIVPVFAGPMVGARSKVYPEAIRDILQQILPRNYFQDLAAQDLPIAKRAQEFARRLPLVKNSEIEEVPSIMSFYLLAQLRSKTCRFFFEMISSWLVPGTSLNNVLFFAGDFRIPEIGGAQIYTICEMTMYVEREENLRQIQRNFPIIQTEIQAGVVSVHHARRILEIKGWSADQKTAEIHERMAYMIKRFPKEFDHDLFTEMQHVLVMCRGDFKAARECRHLARLISVFYLFRQQLLSLVQSVPRKRHLMVKFYKVAVRQGEGKVRECLGMIVGVRFLRDKEFLDERHLLKAICKYIPNARTVEGAFLSHKRGPENVVTLYLEIYKDTEEGFSKEDIQLLEKRLPGDLKDRIEHPMHPVFNPRNEEEIVRNILTLGNQIKFVRDIPQVHVTFDEQTYAYLYFTVIMVRLLKEGSTPVREMFEKEQSGIVYVHDRCRRVGLLRKKYPKEATVFRAKIPKEDFLREDHSIDLNKARQYVVAEVVRVVGEVRDYNGGIIAKQDEVLGALRELLQSSGSINTFLLENFFYALTPMVMRSVMPAHALAVLYRMFAQGYETGVDAERPLSYDFEEDEEFLYTVVVADAPETRDDVDAGVQALGIDASLLARSDVTLSDTPALGYIYRCDDPEARLAFQHAVQLASLASTS